MRINRDVAAHARPEQRSVRLQSPANVENTKIKLGQAPQPVLKNSSAFSKHQPVRISQRGMQAASAIAKNLVQCRLRRHEMLDVPQVFQSLFEERLLGLVERFSLVFG